MNDTWKFVVNNPRRKGWNCKLFSQENWGWFFLKEQLIFHKLLFFDYFLIKNNHFFIILFQQNNWHISSKNIKKKKTFFWRSKEIFLSIKRGIRQNKGRQKERNWLNFFANIIKKSRRKNVRKYISFGVLFFKIIKK